MMGDKKNEWQTVDLKNGESSELREIKQHIMLSSLVNSRDTGYILSDVKLVNNLELLKQYNEKKCEIRAKFKEYLKSKGKKLKNEYIGMVQKSAFYLLCDNQEDYNDQLEKLIDDFANEGLRCTKNAQNFLGESESGIYLCKHIDVLLEYVNKKLPIVKIFLVKIVYHKIKFISNYDQNFNAGKPDKNSDCQSFLIPPSITDSIIDQYLRSLIYIYEYDNDEIIVDRPHSIMPYALITFKRVKLLQSKVLQQKKDDKKIVTFSNELTTSNVESVMSKKDTTFPAKSILKNPASRSTSPEDAESLQVDRLKIRSTSSDSTTNTAYSNEREPESTTSNEIITQYSLDDNIYFTNNEKIPKWILLYHQKYRLNIKFRGKMHIEERLIDFRKIGLNFLDKEKTKLNVKNTVNKILLNKFVKNRQNLEASSNSKLVNASKTQETQKTGKQAASATKLKDKISSKKCTSSQSLKNYKNNKK